MTRRCPDCQVSPGQPHEEGCDVARCPECGAQRLMHEHDEAGWGTWTGEWPGVAECRQLGLYVTMRSVLHPAAGMVKCAADDPDRTEDLNELAMMGYRGELVWDRRTERWVRP